MRLAKEFPLFLGWLLSFVIALALTLILALPYRGKNFMTQEFVNFIVAFIAFYLAVAFLLFVISIKYVVIPLYQKNKIVSSEFWQMKLADYFYRWFLCWIYSVLFSLPLICWDSMFTIVPTPQIEKIVRSLWQLVASYFAYRLVIKRWIEKVTTHNPLENEKQIPVA